MPTNSINDKLAQAVAALKVSLDQGNPYLAGTTESQEWLTWAFRGFMLKGPGPGDDVTPAGHEGWQYGCENRQQIISAKN